MSLYNLMVTEDFETLYEMFCLQCTQDAITECSDAITESIAYIEEGVNIDSFKEYYGKTRDECRDAIKAGNRAYSIKQYALAKKEYQKGLNAAEKMKSKLVSMKNDPGSTFISWCVSYMTPLFTIIGTFDNAIITRKPTSVQNLSDAIDDTMTWNMFKTMFVANCNKLIKWCEVRIKQCDAKN